MSNIIFSAAWQPWLVWNIKVSGEPLTIYIAASFKHMHGVRLLAREFGRMGCRILDWTVMATPPPGLTPAERRIWMDTDQAGGQVYDFCKRACEDADLVVYYGESGQDAGVEIGLAAGAGVPVLGIRGPLEAPGLMLHGAVTRWVDNAEGAIEVINNIMKRETGMDAGDDTARALGKIILRRKNG